MTRDGNYHRKMRAKHIRRKKRILSSYSWFKEFGWYKHDGMYSKGKIHCSCPLCSAKSYLGKHVKTRQEMIADLKLKEFYELDQVESFG